ncbi:MAG: hypothetical protein OXI02_02215 [Candidatus Dadabacteria bacterium]|nr:hypothetical protein [Candidatus Dadabacteria bacterium]MDE0476867.1 hypothetical protein [Candidatus Dadabacteria bacterium]
MSKALFLLLTIVFLGAQMLSFAHAAEYGSLEHEHDGTACEVCLSAKYQGFSSPGAASEACLLHYAEYVPQSPIGVIVVRNAYEAGITRGPPLSS